MSKYYKAEDIQELITACMWRMTLAKERGGEGFVEYDKQIIDVGELRKRLAKLPTIEVSNDAISREWAISFIDAGHLRNPNELCYSENGVVELIKNAPSVIPTAKEGEWIPCSERLPSERGDYLVTFPLCDGEPCVYMLSFNKGKFYETDDEWGDVQYVDVTAWMPLPGPWKGAD